jgi:hypothetical protein
VAGDLGAPPSLCSSTAPLSDENGEGAVGTTLLFIDFFAEGKQFAFRVMPSFLCFSVTRTQPVSSPDRSQGLFLTFLSLSTFAFWR